MLTMGFQKHTEEYRERPLPSTELGSTELTRGVHSPVSTVKKGQAGVLTHALSPSAGTFPDFKFSGFLLFRKYKARTGMVGMMWRAHVAQRPQLDCDVSVGLEFGALTRGSSVKRRDPLLSFCTLVCFQNLLLFSINRKTSLQTVSRGNSCGVSMISIVSCYCRKENNS